MQEFKLNAWNRFGDVFPMDGIASHIDYFNEQYPKGVLLDDSGDARPSDNLPKDWFKLLMKNIASAMTGDVKTARSSSVTVPTEVGNLHYHATGLTGTIENYLLSPQSDKHMPIDFVMSDLHSLDLFGPLAQGKNLVFQQFGYSLAVKSDTPAIYLSMGFGHRYPTAEEGGRKIGPHDFTAQPGAIPDEVVFYDFFEFDPQNEKAVSGYLMTPPEIAASRDSISTIKQRAITIAPDPGVMADLSIMLFDSELDPQKRTEYFMSETV